MMNGQAAAFDDAGEITDLVILTSEWFRENLGVRFETPFCGIFCCDGNRVRKIRLPSLQAVACVVREYASPIVTVFGGEDEEEYVSAVRSLVALANRADSWKPEASAPAGGKA